MTFPDRNNWSNRFRVPANVSLLLFVINDSIAGEKGNRVTVVVKCCVLW